MTNRIEAIAKAICEVQGLPPDERALRWLADERKNQEQEFPNWHDFRNEAQAAIAADPLTQLLNELVPLFRFALTNMTHGAMYHENAAKGEILYDKLKKWTQEAK